MSLIRSFFTNWVAHAPNNLASKTRLSGAVLEPINPISRLSVKVRDRYDDDQVFVDSVDQAVREPANKHLRIPGSISVEANGKDLMQRITCRVRRGNLFLALVIPRYSVINLSLRRLEESNSHWSRYLDMTSS